MAEHERGDSTVPLDDLESSSTLRLLVVGEAGVETHALPVAGAVTVGRGEAADIRIDDRSISREHVRLTVGNKLEIVDLGSQNGTKLRDVRLDPDTPALVAPGDAIEIGSTVLLVQGTLSGGPREAGPGEGKMAPLVRLAPRIAKSNINVVLTGETGAGKEVFARELHRLSPRASQPFLVVNCASLSEQLLESELFGYEPGAFTGAVRSKPGLLETADGGVVFLDEVGELPLPVQAKVLRVLEERTVQRVGGLKPHTIDVRFICATNRDLELEVSESRFRRDLFYRLNGITITIPPLRERPEEIEGLVTNFVSDASTAEGLPGPPRISEEAMAWLGSHDWPGNVRELRNVIARAVMLSGGEPITLEHLPATAGDAPTTDPAGRNAPAPDGDGMRAQILDALERCAGNQTQAAKLLGISRRTLIKRLDAYGIPRPQKHEPKPD